MRANEIRELSVEELISHEKDLKQELFNLKFQHSLGLGQVQNTAKIKDIKRTIARIKTILTEDNKG